jgi:peptide/nickel transport system substrate-binding protein
LKRKLLIIFMALLMITVLTACNDENGEEEGENGQVQEEEAGDPTYGGSLRFAVPEVTHGNVLYQNPDELHHLHQLIFESLVTFDEDFSIIPQIAEDWSISEDGQVVEFVIPSDLTWHDGAPFTVEDIDFTVQAIKNAPEENISEHIYQNSIRHISYVRELENGNVEISFTRPFSSALEALTFAILPSHLFEDNSDLLESDDFPWVGTGAYRLEDRNQESITLTKFEDHNRKDPYIETIEVRIIEDYDEGMTMFEEGELDLFHSRYVDVTGNENVEEAQIHAFASMHFEFLAFNFQQNSPVSENSQIRRVLEEAVNREQVIEEAYFGYATATDTPIHPEHWLHHGDLSQEEPIGDDELEQLMLEEGYERNDDGLWVDESGNTLELQILVNENHTPRVIAAEIIREQLNQNGFDVSLDQDSFDNIQGRLEEGDFDLYFGAWELGMLPDLSFAFHSDFALRTNFMHYENEEMDGIIEEAFRAPSQEAKQEQYQALQNAVRDDLPLISLYFLQDTYLVSEGVYGDISPRAHNIFANIEEWYMETE